MEELHTIVDLSDPDEIRRDIDACATRWQREKPWITRTMHRTVRVWRQVAAIRASRPWAPPCSREQLGAPAFVATPNSPPVSRIQADAHEPDHRGRGVRLVGAVPLAARRIRDHRGRPNSSGRRPYRRQSACACALVPSARAALGVLGHARSDARMLNSFGNLAMPLFSFFLPISSASIGTGSSRDGPPTRHCQCRARH